MANRREELYALLTRRPGLSRSEIGESLGWPPVTLDCSIRNMIGAGLLRYDGVSGHRLYYWRDSAPPTDGRGKSEVSLANLGKSPLRIGKRKAAAEPEQQLPKMPPILDWATVISQLLIDHK